MDKELMTALERSMALISEANRLLKRRGPRYSQPPRLRKCLAGCVALCLCIIALLRSAQAGFPLTAGLAVGAGVASGLFCGSCLYRRLTAAWLRSLRRTLRSEARTVRRRIDSALQWDDRLDADACARLRTIRQGLTEAMEGLRS